MYDYSIVFLKNATEYHDYLLKTNEEKEPFWWTPNPGQGNKAHKGCSIGERKETTKKHQKESLQCDTTNVFGRWKWTESINDLSDFFRTLLTFCVPTYAKKQFTSSSQDTFCKFCAQQINSIKPR